MKKNFLSFMQKSFIILFSFFILFTSAASYALPFNIIPKAGTTLPISVHASGTVTAYYTVYNNTASKRNGNYVQYLPPNVSQVTTGGTYDDTCSSLFSLAANGQSGSSCTLQLTISGAVSSNDLNPKNHLFVCFPGGKTCAGTHYPLNVTQSSGITLSSIAITPTSATIGISGTQQYTATGMYSDSSSADITTMTTWDSSIPSDAKISSTGLATGVASGTTDITATLDSITSNTATLTVKTPVTVSLTTPTASSTDVSRNTLVIITFSGAVEPASVTTSTFKVGTTAGGSDIAGSIVMSAGNTVATYTPSSVNGLPLNTEIFVTVTSGILDASGDPITANSFIFTTQVGYLIYISTATVSGSMSGMGGGGLIGADSVCQSDSQCPLGATCKAMLVGTNGSFTREASPTLTNWVLQPSTLYVNTSTGHPSIGTTTSNAIFIFPLTNVLSSSFAFPWTGLNTDWTTNTTFNCTNWTSGSVSDSGQAGLSLATDSSAISLTTIACSQVAPLYCVQQP